MANTVVCANCNHNLGPREQAAQPCPRCGASGLLDSITHDWRQACLDRIKSVPPSCLAPFTVAFEEKPAIANNGFIYSGWKISCSCGSTNGKLLGYKRGQQEYLGAPLTFECAACAKREELLDPAKHGYAGGLYPDEASNPSQENATAFACPSCAKQDFTVSCVFIIPDAAFDLVEDSLLEQAGLGYADNIQNLFDQFSAECTCAACSRKAFAASMELK